MIGSFILIVAPGELFFGKNLNRINDLADQTFLAFTAVDAFTNLERLFFCTSEDVVGVKSNAYPLSEPAVSTPLAEQVAV